MSGEAHAQLHHKSHTMKSYVGRTCDDMCTTTFSVAVQECFETSILTHDVSSILLRLHLILLFFHETVADFLGLCSKEKRNEGSEKPNGLPTEYRLNYLWSYQ